MSDLRTSLERVGERIAPRPDAFERLDRRRSRKQRNQRIAAGVVAAIVAVAGSVALYAGFRGATEQPGGPLGEVVALWPERSLADALAVQDKVDAADPALQWRLDPVTVTQGFADQALAWSDAQVGAPRSTTAGSVAPVTVEITGSPVSCPTPLPAEAIPPLCSVPLRQATITLDRVAAPGDGGIWSVTQVESPGVHLPVAPGAVLAPGDRLQTSAPFSDQVLAAAGYRFRGPGGCTVESDGTSGSGNSGDVELTVPTSLPAGCHGRIPGYVYAYSATTVRPVDPFEHPVHPLAFAAVPATLLGGEGGAISGTPPAEREWRTYTDDLGWSIDYPSDWTVTPIATQGRASFTGASFANYSQTLAPSEATPSPVPPDSGSIPADGVVLTITHREGGPGPAMDQDDSSFPLSMDDFAPTPTPQGVAHWTLEVRGNGLAYLADVWAGSDAASHLPAALSRMIASIWFPEPTKGAVLNGYLVMDAAEAYPVGSGTLVADTPSGVQPFMLIHAPGGFYALEIDRQLCSDPALSAWDPSARQVTCKRDGFVWDRNGTPLPGGGPIASGPLPVHPAIVAWNGDVMVAPGVTYGELPPSYWR